MPYPSKFVEFFGPCTWKTMHAVAFNYGVDPTRPSPEEENAARHFFDALKHLLPCEACGKHYQAYLEKHPPDVTSREALSRWVYDLHSNVNERRHVSNPGYDEVKKDYTGWNAHNADEFAHLSVQKRLHMLADPHLGRPIAAGSETMTGGSFFDFPDQMIGIVVGGAAVGGLLYYFYMKKDKENTK